jgi:hypothetical protein
MAAERSSALTMQTARAASLAPSFLCVSLALGPLLAACGSPGGPAVPPAASCPPMPSVTAPQVASASAPVPAATVVPRPVDTGAERLLWDAHYDDGGVYIYPSGEDVVVVPQFMATSIEGTRVAALDPAGMPRWESAFSGVGAVSAAVAPGGAVLAITADRLDWPRTTEPYEQRRVVVIENRKTRSWSLPSGIALSQIDVDEQGQVVVAGVFTGTVKLSASVTLQAPKDARGFVARTDLQGHVLWARDFAVAVSAAALRGGKVLVRELPEDRRRTPGRLHLLGAGGKPEWHRDAPGRCEFESIAKGPLDAIHVVASAPCFGAVAPEKGADAESWCELATLDPLTGMPQKTRLVPGCWVHADAQGFVVADRDSRITALDTAGKELWSADPQRSWCMAFEWSDVAVTPRSVYVAGQCHGARIGTMFNSPYSRAGDRSLTYLVRYAR